MGCCNGPYQLRWRIARLMSNAVTHLLFDLGGVVVELRGTPILNEWSGADKSHEQLWEQWLTSDAPREFESGKIDKHTFASRVVDELSLTIAPSEFLAHFTQLPIGPYPGAIDLINSLRPRYTTALFSNSNAIHWKRKIGEMQLGPVFDFHFASHLIGYVKPDKEAFEAVLEGLGVPADQILFFDDNKMNVDAAIGVGMQARHVVGFDALRSVLAESCGVVGP